jgi:hypothetical protein
MFNVTINLSRNYTKILLKAKGFKNFTISNVKYLMKIALDTICKI